MIMSRDVHDAVNDARTGNMSSYNALPLKECTPTSGHQIWQPNVKSGEAVCLAHQSRCKVNWSAETITKNAVGMIVRDGDPSSPPSDIFMAETAYSEYKTYESKPVRNALFGVAFAVSGLYFWSTAGSVVKNWVVVRVEKYTPKLLEPQFQTMLTLTAFFGIIYFGMKLRGSSKGLTIPSMIDLPLESAAVDA